MHCVDLGESFQTHIYLQNLALIQPRTSLLKVARSLAVHQPTPRAGLDAVPVHREEEDGEVRGEDGGEEGQPARFDYFHVPAISHDIPPLITF